ncbi:winged helix-turn-helix transcriptional regulator [Mucilaginibacter sp. X4EP1]|uniref:winged helix-turn-helix transcriptional regulator n=1 Tax=Mucilaginibacter sp. X4EP1 TaxID=2723092 RepID=UPI002166D405|nr:helix-turn-helix domain-containing protein [Mucilaginibacter sp. X4EP1]MCS3811531.1 DNA-binding HxlR family transcriptional regulator [Mucilaginibacter sp. X4EP1]
MTRKNIQSTDCTVDFAFQRIGGKYKGRILWYLHSHRILRYGELRRQINGVTAKMLTQTLRELEEDGLINREVFHQVPPKVEYSLSETGRELIPFIMYLNKWGEKQMAKSGSVSLIL